MNEKLGRLVAMIVGLSSLHTILCSGELGKPSLIVPKYALVGDFVDFKCHLPVRHDKVIGFKFYKEEDNTMFGDTSLQPNEAEAKIIILVQQSNQGHVVCKAEVQNDTNVTSLLSSTVYFNVIDPIQQVVLTIRPKLGEVFENDDLILSCEVQGGEDISYNWLLDGKLLEVSSNPLHIRGVTQGDAGSYSCLTSIGTYPEHNKTSNNVTVMVKEMLSTPEVTFTVHKKQDQYFAEITCRSDRGALPANFSLRTFNETGTEFRTRSADHFLNASFTVLLSPGRSTNRAQCWVTDGRSTLKSDSVLLEVVPVGGTVHINLEYDIDYNFEVVGVTLQCMVERGTHPIYRWYLNDSLLIVEPGDQFYRLSDRGRSLTPLNIQMSTFYRCEATDIFNASSNFSSKLLLINQDVLKNHVPTEVKALVLGCSLLLVALLTGCCIYGAKYSQRQPPKTIRLNRLDSESGTGEKEDEELGHEDYEEDLDLVRAADMGEEDEADVDSLEDWIGTE